MQASFVDEPVEGLRSLQGKCRLHRHADSNGSRILVGPSGHRGESATAAGAHEAARGALGLSHWQLSLSGQLRHRSEPRLDRAISGNLKVYCRPADQLEPAQLSTQAGVLVRKSPARWRLPSPKS